MLLLSKRVSVCIEAAIGLRIDIGYGICIADVAMLLFAQQYKM